MQDNTGKMESTLISEIRKTSNGNNGLQAVESSTANSPWLGLSSYQEENADIFFGRSKESDELFYKIYDNIVTCVYGVSGVGKTSLLQAGVFPKLRKKQFFPIYLRLDHSKGSASYIKQIIELITSSLEEHYCTIKEIAPLPGNALENLWTWLHRHKFYDVMDVRIRPVLVFDQFEEIFTISEKDESEINNAIIQICDVAGDHLPAELEAVINKDNVSLAIPVQAEYRIILSLRDDFIARLDEMSNLCPPLRQNRISVKPMSEENAREVIFNDKTKDICSESVCESIIKAVSENTLSTRRSFKKVVEPALLSLFCEQINLCRLEQSLPRITEKLVRENKDNILGKFYDNAMQKVSLHTCETLEEELVSDSGFRLLKAVDDLKLPRDEIYKLVNLRLLRTDNRNCVQYIEFCHDIIIPIVERKKVMRYQQKKAKFYRKIYYSVIVPTVFFIIIFFLFFKEYKTYYKNWHKIYGVPNGFNRLSKRQAKHREFSYEIKTIGMFDFDFRWHDYWKCFKLNDWKSYIPFKRSSPYRLSIVNNHLKTYDLTDRCFDTYIWSSNESSSNTNNTNKLVGITEDELKSVVIIDFSYIEDKDGNKIPLSEIGKNKKGYMIWGAFYIPQYDIHGNKRDPKKTYDNNIIEKKEEKNQSVFHQESKKNAVDQKNLVYNNEHQSKPLADHNQKNHLFKNQKNDKLSLKTSKNKDQKFVKQNIIRPKTDALIMFIQYNGSPILRSQENDDESSEELIYVGINYYKENEKDGMLGFEKEWIWEDSLGNYIRGLDNSHKRIFQYTKNKNEYDFVESITIISQEFNNGTFRNFCDNAGNCILKIEYDQNGNSIMQSYYDENKKLIKMLKDNGNYDTVIYEHDEYGNMTKATFWKHDENYIYNKYIFKENIKRAFFKGNIFRIDFKYTNGIHTETIQYMIKDRIIGSNIIRVRQKYNINGNIIEEEYLAYETGENLSFIDDTGLCKIKSQYNKDDYEEKRFLYYFNIYDLSRNTKFIRVEQTFNKAGNIIEENNFTNERNIFYDTHGISSCKMEYDSMTGLILKKKIEYGKNLYNIPGIMRIERKYNENGNEIEKIYYASQKGLDLACNEENICKTITSYNGNEIIIDSFALPGKFLFNSMAVTKRSQKITVDGNKKTIQELYYDERNHPILNYNGIHKGVASYELYGDNFKMISLTAYDEVNQLTPFSGDMAIQEWQYDSQGNCLQEFHYANDKKTPACDDNGISRIEHEYDEKGNEKKKILYSLPGKGIMGDKNVMRVEYTFTSHHNILTEKHYAAMTGNELACNSNGISLYKNEYYIQTDEIEILNRKIEYGHDLYGNHNVMRIEKKYNKRGDEVEKLYYSSQEGSELTCDSNNICRTITSYYGYRLIRIDSFALPGQYLFNGTAITMHRKFIDVEGNNKTTEELYYAMVYFDEKGEYEKRKLPAVNHKGIHRSTASYKLYGDNFKMTSLTAYDEGNQLIPFSGNMAIQEWQYDSQGNCLQEFHYADGQKTPTCDDEGISRIEHKYDEKGNETRRIFYSLPSKGVWGNKDVIRVEQTFNLNHKVLVEKHFANVTGDEMACDSNGISWYENIYDVKTGRWVKCIRYSMKGKGVEDSKDVIREERIFNVKGQLLEIKRFDSELGNNPTCNNEGIYKDETAYHENGKIKQRIFYSLPNKGIKDMKDIIRIERFYDTDGILKEEKSYNQNGEIVPNISNRDGNKY